MKIKFKFKTISFYGLSNLQQASSMAQKQVQIKVFPLKPTNNLILTEPFKTAQSDSETELSNNKKNEQQIRQKRFTKSKTVNNPNSVGGDCNQASNQVKDVFYQIW